MRCLHSSRIETRTRFIERASMQRDEAARAIEAVRCLISGPESEAVTLGNEKESEPIVEYRGGGQLAALFRPDQFVEISASSGVVLSARSDFTYRKEPSSDAIFMRGYVGAEDNFTIPMLAVTIQDAHYGVAASGLQWNIRLALVWTRVEVSDDNSLLKLAFQWRFHEHPHPFQLLEWSHEWREFVRQFQASPGPRLDRIAYAWIFYQLEWLGAGMRGVPSPLRIKSIDDSHWKKLLKVDPPKDKDGKRESWGSQDWRTQTLPLLARPEIGLPPSLQWQLLEALESEGDSRAQEMQQEWLKAQRRRLVTDAIIAAEEEEEGHRAEDAENEKRVDRIVGVFEEQHLRIHGESSPWRKTVKDLADDTP